MSQETSSYRQGSFTRFPFKNAAAGQNENVTAQRPADNRQDKKLKNCKGEEELVVLSPAKEKISHGKRAQRPCLPKTQGQRKTQDLAQRAVKRIACLIFFALIVINLTRGLVFAQQTFGTTIYFDYVYFLTDKGPKTTTTAPGYRDNFFQFRRAYFTYENRIGDRLRFRFRYDADNTSNVTSVNFKQGTTSSDAKLRPYMKHLYVELSDFLVKNTRLRLGMADTLTFKPAEDKWGYRSVAKTIVDGYKDITGEDIDATSADIGVWYGGSFNKYARWAFMLTNGSHYTKIENDKYKKIMGQLHLLPIAGLSLVGYIDYEKQTADASAYTYKLDVYLEMVRNLVIGSEYFVYSNDLKVVKTTNQKYDVSGFSVYGNYILKRDVLAVFGRYDYYEPNNKTAKDRVNLIIAGLDWSPLGSSLRIQPNIWFYQYEDTNKKDDLIFQFTFFLSF